MGHACHIYISRRIRGLAKIEGIWGLDKPFPELGMESQKPSTAEIAEQCAQRAQRMIVHLEFKDIGEMIAPRNH